MNNDKCTDYFDARAPAWDEHYRRSGLFRFRHHMFEQTIAENGPRYHRALDYGCGSGALTGLLAQFSESVVATDISEKMREISRRKFETSPNVEIVMRNALQQAQFDLAICSSVIEYVDNPRKFLAELVDYLQPGGLLLITFSNKYAPLQIFNRRFLSVFKRDIYTNVQNHVFSRRSILQLSRDTHLEPIKLKTPIGLPLFSTLGWGELFFLVARKNSG